jgi:hypothetical protein
MHGARFLVGTTLLPRRVLLQDPECGCVFDGGKQLPEDLTEDKDAVCASSAPALLNGLGQSRSVEVCCVSCLLLHKAGCTEQGTAGPASVSSIRASPALQRSVC